MNYGKLVNIVIRITVGGGGGGGVSSCVCVHVCGHIVAFKNSH